MIGPLWGAAAIAWLSCLTGGLIAYFIDPGAITMCVGSGLAAVIFTLIAGAISIAEYLE